MTQLASYMIQLSEAVSACVNTFQKGAFNAQAPSGYLVLQLLKELTHGIRGHAPCHVIILNISDSIQSLSSEFN